MLRYSVRRVRGDGEWQEAIVEAEHKAVRLADRCERLDAGLCSRLSDESSFIVAHGLIAIRTGTFRHEPMLRPNFRSYGDSPPAG